MLTMPCTRTGITLRSIPVGDGQRYIYPVFIRAQEAPANGQGPILI